MEEIGIIPKKGFLVGGVSAGANLAIVISHHYCDEGLSPPLTGQYLSIPTVCGSEPLPSKYKDIYLAQKQNNDVLILNQNSIDLFESESTIDENNKLLIVNC